jgi:hypothetical protein
VAVKFCFITFIGEGVSPLKKGKITTYKGSVTEVFEPFHVRTSAAEAARGHILARAARCQQRSHAAAAAASPLAAASPPRAEPFDLSGWHLPQVELLNATSVSEVTEGAIVELLNSMFGTAKTLAPVDVSDTMRMPGGRAVPVVKKNVRPPPARPLCSRHPLSPFKPRCQPQPSPPPANPPPANPPPASPLSPCELRHRLPQHTCTCAVTRIIRGRLALVRSSPRVRAWPSSRRWACRTGWRRPSSRCA